MNARETRHSRTCTVTRPPATGSTGITVVASQLPCSPPWPARPALRVVPELATILELYEMTSDAADFRSDDSLTLDDGTRFKIKSANRWEGSRPGRPPFYALILVRESHP